MQSPAQKPQPTDYVAQMATLSASLLTEVECFEEFVECNGVGFHQVEAWAQGVKEKLYQVQANLAQVQTAKSGEGESKESTASKEKSFEMVGDLQIEDYLE